jgi:hypothetical protein
MKTTDFMLAGLERVIQVLPNMVKKALPAAPRQRGQSRHRVR